MASSAVTTAAIQNRLARTQIRRENWRKIHTHRDIKVELLCSGLRKRM